jgi:hypothetical protein
LYNYSSGDELVGRLKRVEKMLRMIPRAVDVVK